MRQFRAWFVRFRSLLDRDRREREIAAEIDSHLQLHIQDNLRAGMSAAEARRQALLKLGGIEAAKELYRERRGLPLLETFLQDLRYAARSLRKSPGFALIALVTLALGIGANTAVFSMVNALLLHPYDFHDLERLVRVWEDRGVDEGFDARRMAPADADELRNTTQIFEGLATYRYEELSLNTDGGMQPVRAAGVSTNFFDVLAVTPAIGRTFTAAEQQPGAGQVAIVSYGFWQRRSGGDPALLGKDLQLNGRKYTVVGIMPIGFDYPAPVELWVPLALTPAERADRSKLSLEALGRLQQGVTPDQARAQLDSVAHRWQQQYPQTNSNRRAALLQLRKELYSYTLPLFLLLQAAAVFVLLLACANLANLLFARIFARQKEIAVRTALGAARSRLARMFITETLLLCCIAGLVAILTSFWSVKLLRTSISPRWTMWVPGWDGIQADRSVLALTIALVTVVGIVFGLATVLYTGKSEPYTTLKEGSRGSTLGGRARFRSALVVAQTIFALVLLVCAGLTTDAFLRLAKLYRGFEPANVLRIELGLPENSYSDNSQITNFYERALAGAAALPGVNSASLVTNSPASNVDNETTLFTIAGRANLKLEETPSIELQVSTPDFFRELRIPLLAGRVYSAADSAATMPVVVISRTMARQYWPGGNELGQRIKIGAADSSQPWMTIVGVVEDVRQNWWKPTARATIYQPFLQAPRRSMVLLVRADYGPARLTAGISEIVKGIDNQIAVAAADTLETEITDSIAIVRILGVLTAIFGCVALILASVGLYGVLAESVARRIPEIGLRVALGARPEQITKLVLGQALRLTGVGLIIGVPTAFAVNRAMSSLIFGIVSVNAAVLAGFTLLLVFVALIAAYVPARRAMRVDPMVALRYE
jgi:putative ABC transport system permease protein